MRKSLCLFALFASIFFMGNTFGQTTLSPKVTSTTCPKLKIKSIIIEEGKTTVIIEYTATERKEWFYFSSNTYMYDYYNANNSYKIISLGNNTLDTEYSLKRGESYCFYLIFPKLKPGIEFINIKEVVSNAIGFEWIGISITNPANNKPKAEWAESSLKTYWETNGVDFLEGIYEKVIQTNSSPKYKLALKKNSEGYELIYLSGDENQPSRFKEGDIKAFLTYTAADNLFKAKWYMKDKSINENLYISFEDALMKIYWTDTKVEDLYIKLYPATTSSANSGSFSASGTGFALTNNGYIVTNYHVIDEASSIVVKGVNGDFSTSYNARVIVSDKNNDLAIIQIDDDAFTSITNIPYIMKSTTSDVGESVFVLGFPLRATMGDEIKLTDGIISAKTGFQGDITSYQISAPVQPGNSGGPLFDKSGNLIGVVNAKHTGAENASYAIKISYLKNLIDLLPTTPILNSKNTLANMTLSEQVKHLSKIVYIIEVK